jgi:hypothetical protein
MFDVQCLNEPTTNNEQQTTGNHSSQLCYNFRHLFAIKCQTFVPMNLESAKRKYADRIVVQKQDGKKYIVCNIFLFGVTNTIEASVIPEGKLTAGYGDRNTVTLAELEDDFEIADMPPMANENLPSPNC